MSAASCGLFATKTRPLSRSSHRKAGIPSVVPCRMPIWLAGVVAGMLGVHSTRRCEPDRTQRARVGRVPAMTPHCRTGYGTPSSCTNTTPGRSGSPTVVGCRRACRIILAVTAWLVPAVVSQVMSVTAAAMIQLAQNTGQNDVATIPGSSATTTATTSALPIKASTSAPGHPSLVAIQTSTGLTRAPTTAIANAPATSHGQLCTVSPGSTQSAAASPAVPATNAATTRRRSLAS